MRITYETIDQTFGLYLTSIADIPKGQEVFWNYGNKGNIEFLVLYGFVCSDGSQEKSAVLTYTPNFDPNNKLDAVKREIFKMNNFQGSFNWKVTEKMEGELLTAMLSTLRIIAMTDEDMKDQESVRNLA